jgi:hypothetical protein
MLGGMGCSVCNAGEMNEAVWHELRMSGGGQLDGFHVSGYATGGSDKNIGGRFGGIAELQVIP